MLVYENHCAFELMLNKRQITRLECSLERSQDFHLRFHPSALVRFSLRVRFDIRNRANRAVYVFVPRVRFTNRCVDGASPNVMNVSTFRSARPSKGESLIGTLLSRKRDDSFPFSVPRRSTRTRNGTKRLSVTGNRGRRDATDTLIITDGCEVAC